MEDNRNNNKQNYSNVNNITNMSYVNNVNSNPNRNSQSNSPNLQKNISNPESNNKINYSCFQPSSKSPTHQNNQTYSNHNTNNQISPNNKSTFQPNPNLINQNTNNQINPNNRSTFQHSNTNTSTINTKSNSNPNNINNENLQTLLKSQNLYLEANELLKNFCYPEAVIKYEEALTIADNIYLILPESNIYLRTKIEEFIRNIKKMIDFSNNQNKEKYQYKQNSGKSDIKIDYLSSIREDENAKKKKKQLIVQSNNGSDINKPKSAEIVSKNPMKKDKEKSELESRILDEIIDKKPSVKFDDIYGLGKAKQALKEIIILPALRPDLFTGLRAPPRGLLLFGPPGTGKTMIAKAVASECKCTFFNISSSSLTSKYVGDSEKLVRSLFDLANEKQPSIVFIDEIDSILSKRTDSENEASKRLKTEFLVQFDGVGSDLTKKVLIIGATNRPFDLDPAVLRRLPKRIYIGPFSQSERALFLKQTMKTTDSNISDKDYEYIASLTDNYSNSDLKELCKEAACEPIREIKDISKINEIVRLRDVNYNDFLKAVKAIRGTLTKEVLEKLNEWNKTYGAI